MPKFYLNLRNGDETIEDPDGCDSADLQGAIAEARAGARDILASMLRRGEALDGQSIEITDESGALLATVRFKDVFSAG